MNPKTKQMILSALCKHFSLDPAPFLGGAAENDVKTLYSNVLKASGKEVSAQNNNEEVLKWLDFAQGLPENSKDCFAALEKLNVELAVKSVLLGNGLTPSAADVAVFSSLHSSVLDLSDSDNEKIPHVIRWVNYIQNKEKLSTLFGPIPVKLPLFDFEVSKSVIKVDANSNTKNAAESAKPVAKSEAQPSTKKTEPEEPKKKATKEKDAKKDKKKPAETEPANKEAELSVSLLNIQVGLIRKAWKHPSADSLLVEEIDVGEGKVRQVVSGLAKFCSPDDLANRLVALITNVKPGKLRDVMSEGLVLCASNEDHSVVEPLLPPAGAKPGERISFTGIEGKPEDVLNPKKKQLEKITPHLYTDESGVATYKGIPFMTSAGPCSSSIPKATIK